MGREPGGQPHGRAAILTASAGGLLSAQVATLPTRRTGCASFACDAVALTFVADAYSDHRMDRDESDVGGDRCRLVNERL